MASGGWVFKCEHCGHQEIKTKGRRDARFCDGTCRKAAHDARKREKWQAFNLQAPLDAGDGAIVKGGTGAVPVPSNAALDDGNAPITLDTLSEQQFGEVPPGEGAEAVVWCGPWEWVVNHFAKEFRIEGGYLVGECWKQESGEWAGCVTWQSKSRVVLRYSFYRYRSNLGDIKEAIEVLLWENYARHEDARLVGEGA